MAGRGINERQRSREAWRESSRTGEPPVVFRDGNQIRIAASG